jgi:hypothetical protein
MRQDEKTALREEKKRTINELRTLTDAATKNGWTPAGTTRWSELESKAQEINHQLQAQHERELVEIRKHRSAIPAMPLGSFTAPELERSFAREPLYDAFRSKGFARGEPAEIEWAEYRAVTWTGSVDNMNQPRRDSVALGYDQRYAYEALPSVGVDSGVTSISLLTQTARTLATPANVIRAIDAVTAKPETTETLTVSVVPLKQLATVVSDIPNVFIENEQVGSIIQNDCRLAITDALDDLLKTSVAASGFQAPGADPLLISIRKAMSTVMSSSYSPDTLILRPADAEALDTLRTSGTELFYVFAAGNFAPSTLFAASSATSPSLSPLRS